MKVRYWNSQRILTVPSPKDLVSQIKFNGTVATGLPSGDIPVLYAFYLLGGRGSIDQLLAHTDKVFYGETLEAKYVRFNAGIGKHYTIVAIMSRHAGSVFGDSRIWTSLNIIQQPTGPRGGIAYNSPSPQGVPSLINSVSCRALAIALRSAEAKMQDVVLNQVGF